jgi:hypothetical protein
MNWFVDKLKLNAAARSMHQFCPIVRTIYPDPPSNEAVEAATVYLYAGLAQEIFGKRFTIRLREEIRNHYKYAEPIEVDLRVIRMEQRVELLRREARTQRNGNGNSQYVEFTQHVHNVIRALLSEAGDGFDNPQVVKLIFPRFEEAVRRIKTHLLGIKHQSRYVMRNS